MLLAVGAVGPGVQLVLRLQPNPPPALTAAALTLAAVAIAVAAAAWWGRLRRWRRWTAMRHGRSIACTGCGYDLRGLPTEPDGRTLCPECGAAWLVAGGVGAGPGVLPLRRP